MSKFALKTIEAVCGNQVFKQLVVLKNNVNADKIQNEINIKEAKNEEVNIEGQLDIYENKMEAKYERSLNSIYTIMNMVANLRGLADTQFRDITPSKEIIKEYEFKSGDLRVYAIKALNGKIIILGGYKNEQDKNIVEFRALKRMYLQSINNKK